MHVNHRRKNPHTYEGYRRSDKKACYKSSSIHKMIRRTIGAAVEISNSEYNRLIRHYSYDPNY